MGLNQVQRGVILGMARKAGCEGAWSGWKQELEHVLRNRLWNLRPAWMESHKPVQTATIRRRDYELVAARLDVLRGTDSNGRPLSS